MTDHDTNEKSLKNDEKWKKELPEDVFNIVRNKGTERAFTGEYDKFYEQGKYYCRCCGAHLFDSETKYNSGSGWPSFYDADAANIGEKTDGSWIMQRTEIVCKQCEAHLGHVFEDGPQPTGLRYCVNSVSLSFKNEENE